MMVYSVVMVLTAWMAGEALISVMVAHPRQVIRLSTANG
jgi:hypothetical protein